MADEPPRMVTMPCVKCGRPAVAGVELEGGQQVNVCWEHLQQHEAMRMRKIEMYQRTAERAKDNIAEVVGARRRQRPQRIPAPRVDVQQVHIYGDNVGVVNTGVVGSIENNLSIINAHDAAFAGLLKQLTERIIASPALTNTKKREAVDLLNEITDDAAKPAHRRRPRPVMLAIATGLGAVLSHVGDLCTLWTAIASHLNLSKKKTVSNTHRVISMKGRT
jgi:hypothetical protein